MPFSPSSASGDKLLHEGVLYHVLLDHAGQPSENGPEKDECELLGVSGDRIVVQNTVTYVGYTQTQGLVVSESSRHVTVGENGQFVVGPKPHAGFSLSAVKDTKWILQLSYRGECEFDMFSDGSVGWHSARAGGRKVAIFYEIDWPLPISESEGDQSEGGEDTAT